MVRKVVLLFIGAVLLVSLAAGCASRDLASVSGASRGSISVGDAWGNSVTLSDPAPMVEALRAAKPAKDPGDITPESGFEYVITTSSGKIYYDSSRRYLVFVDSRGTRRVYQGDLSAVLGSLRSQLPPVFKPAIPDQELQSWLPSLANTKDAVAMVFDRAGKYYLVVCAGEVPSAGYSLRLAGVAWGTSPGWNVNKVLVKFRLEPPSGGAAAVISYPYSVYEMSAKVPVEVEFEVPTATGEKVVRVPVASVGKNVILFHPEAGSVLTERVRLTGKARVFEATMAVEIEDGHDVLAKKTVTTTAGAPEWGDFDVWVDLKVPTNPFGTIIFVTYSPKDGSRVEELLVPVAFGGK